MATLEEKINHIVDERYLVFKEGSRKSIIKNLVTFVISYGEKEVKKALHKERSLRASAEYKNKAGETQK